MSGSEKMIRSTRPFSASTHCLAFGALCGSTPAILPIRLPMGTTTGRAGRLDGQVALVTGGASGLGRAIVARFVAEGARVAVLDRSAEGLDALRREHGERVTVTPGDVRDVAANERAVSAC